MLKEKERVVEQAVNFTRKVRQVEKRCPICGETFWGAATRVYDKRACRNKAFYQQHAEDRREERRKKYRHQKQQASKS